MNRDRAERLINRVRVKLVGLRASIDYNQRAMDEYNSAAAECLKPKAWRTPQEGVAAAEAHFVLAAEREKVLRERQAEVADLEELEELLTRLRDADGAP